MKTVNSKDQILIAKHETIPISDGVSAYKKHLSVNFFTPSKLIINIFWEYNIWHIHYVAEKFKSEQKYGTIFGSITEISEKNQLDHLENKITRDNFLNMMITRGIQREFLKKQPAPNKLCKFWSTLNWDWK